MPPKSCISSETSSTRSVLVPSELSVVYFLSVENPNSLDRYLVSRLQSTWPFQTHSSLTPVIYNFPHLLGSWRRIALCISVRFVPIPKCHVPWLNSHKSGKPVPLQCFRLLLKLPWLRCFVAYIECVHLKWLFPIYQYLFFVLVHRITSITNWSASANSLDLIILEYFFRITIKAAVIIISGLARGTYCRTKLHCILRYKRVYI